ncbi:MAG TPA: ATP-binding protein [Thermoanaerobaculia bacterium]|nr:ATP-binding protein [Thermoanaerobaculia bacterium]
MFHFVTKEEVLDVLHGFNPWWTGKQEAIPPFRRLAFFIGRKHLEDSSLRRAILLAGPRRVGKSTILLQLAADRIAAGAEPASVLYLSLDNPVLRMVRLSEILSIYHATMHAEGKPATLLLDEVHYANDWELEIKQLVDHRPSYRILATGSATVVQKHALAESGVGRWLTVSVPTLSFYEFVQITREHQPDVSPTLIPSHLAKLDDAKRRAIAAALRPLLPLFQRYLFVGGFPETAMQSDVTLAQRLLREDVVERVLHRDMVSLFGVRNVDELERLFLYLCFNSGGIFAVNTVASELGTTKTTIASHLEILERAHLIYRLAPIATGGKKILKAKQKIYLVDAALRNAMLLRTAESVQREDLGMVVETTVLRHVIAYHYNDRPKFGYWRDAPSGKEVDVIVESPAYNLPFEVKYRSNAVLTASEGIVHYCREADVTEAMWVTRDDRDFDVVTFPGVRNQFVRVPAHILTFLLGQAERVKSGV